MCGDWHDFCSKTEKIRLTPRPVQLQGKGQYEQPLKAATNWTFMGGYRP